MLIPFIENAFKYGVSTDNRSEIGITIEVKNSTLMMNVINSITSSSSIDGTNNGLEVTKRRLILLYPGKHDLQIMNNGDLYQVSLSIRLN